jgi:hypothetical protein
MQQQELEWRRPLAQSDASGKSERAFRRREFVELTPTQPETPGGWVLEIERRTVGWRGFESSGRPTKGATDVA